MVLQEFLELLKQTTGQVNWFIEDGEIIKGESPNGNTYCPITAVCFQQTNKYIQIIDAPEAGEMLELSKEATWKIIHATDWDALLHRRFELIDLRSAMMQAVGLTL